MSYFRNAQAPSAMGHYDSGHARRYESARQAWKQRKSAHERAESNRVDRLDEWAAIGVLPQTRRLDIVGGSLRSRQALLTVYAASTLPERPVIILDLTADKSCEQLVSLAIDAGVPVDLQLLPSGLADTILLAGLEPGQLVDVLIEAMYGDNVHATLAERQPAYLTCFALDDDRHSAQNELLVDIMVQWLTRQLKLAQRPAPAVIVVGGEDVKRRHRERLSDVCERRDVQLMFLFPQFHEATQELIGGDAVGFMRLGNHKEAMSGAEFIGRGYKFEFSQLTKTLGGNESYSVAKSDGRPTTQGSRLSSAISWGTNWNSTTSETRQPDFLGAKLGSTTRGHSTGGSRSRTETTSINEPTTADWSTTQTVAEEINWSNAGTRQRVYEFVMEPAALQSLPDFVLLLLDRQINGEVRWIPVEFNPEIITMDRVSTVPLSKLPRHRSPVFENALLVSGVE